MPACGTSRGHRLPARLPARSVKKQNRPSPLPREIHLYKIKPGLIYLATLLKSNICIAMETSAPSGSYTRAPSAGYATAGSCAGPHPTTLGETRQPTLGPGRDGWDSTRDITSLPCRAQPREPPFEEEKASTVFSDSFFLLLTLDTMPLHHPESA